jgi:hypothetical protein
MVVPHPLQNETPFAAFIIHLAHTSTCLPYPTYFTSVYTSRHLPGTDTGSIGALGVIVVSQLHEIFWSYCSVNLM